MFSNILVLVLFTLMDQFEKKGQCDLSHVSYVSNVYPQRDGNLKEMASACISPVHLT